MAVMAGEGVARPDSGRWRLGGAGGRGRHDVGDYGWLEGQRREVGMAWQGDGSRRLWVLEARGKGSGGACAGGWGFKAIVLQ
jgi:hypothetical protein